MQAMLSGNDNDIYPEYTPLADALLRTLLEDKYPFVWDTYLLGSNHDIRCTLSSPFSDDHKKAYWVALRLLTLALYCHIDISRRAEALVGLLPSLQSWLLQSAILLPKDACNASLPVFRPPTDISRL